MRRGVLRAASQVARAGSRRGLFSSGKRADEVASASTGDWLAALQLPPAWSEEEEKLAHELAPSVDALIRTRWEVPAPAEECVPSAMQTGHLSQHVSQLDGLLLREDAPFPATLSRVIALTCFEYGDTRLAEVSLARSGLLNSSRASDPSQLSSAFATAAFLESQMEFVQRGEELCSRALGIDSTNAFALLALCECLLQQGRARECLRILRDTEEEWRGVDNELEKVLLCRRALCFYELGDDAACLRTLGDAISYLKPKSQGCFDHWARADIIELAMLLALTENCLHATRSQSIVSSILAQLPRPSSARKPTCDALSEGILRLLIGASKDTDARNLFINVDDLPSTQWDEVADNSWEQNGTDLMMISSLGSNELVLQTQKMALPLFKAFQATIQGEPDKYTVQMLLGAKTTIIPRLGGAFVTNKDNLDQAAFLIIFDWAKRTRNAEAIRIARALSFERLARRPASAQTWFWHAQVLGDLLGDLAAAHSAKTRAMDLGLGQGGQGAN